MLSKLSETGTAGFVLANGSMSSNTSGEGEIRAQMIENDIGGMHDRGCPVSCSSPRKFRSVYGLSPKIKSDLSHGYRNRAKAKHCLSMRVTWAP